MPFFYAKIMLSDEDQDNDLGDFVQSCSWYKQEREYQKKQYQPLSLRNNWLIPFTPYPRESDLLYEV